MAKYKKKVIKKKKVITKAKGQGIKKPKKRIKDSGTLPPMVITPRGSKYGDEPFVRRRKIPKDVTKRTPLKRKVPKRKSAVERERRVQFAKDNPLMPRKPKPRSRSALDMSMLLSPIGGPVSRLVGKGAKKLLQSKRAKFKATKKRKKGLVKRYNK